MNSPRRVPLHAAADHRALRHVQCGEQRRRAMALVVSRSYHWRPLTAHRSRAKVYREIKLKNVGVGMSVAGACVPRHSRSANWPEAAPLGLITLAATLPPNWDIRLVNRNTEELTDADLAWADIVMTGGMLTQQVDTLELIALCHAHGKPVAVGGPDQTSSPQVYAAADFRVLCAIASWPGEPRWWRSMTNASAACGSFISLSARWASDTARASSFRCSSRNSPTQCPSLAMLW